MKNIIATIILGIAVLFIGIASAFHIWTPEQKTEHFTESAGNSTLWSDFSHPDTLTHRALPDLLIDEKIAYTNHENGFVAMLDYSTSDCVVKVNDGTGNCIKWKVFTKRGFWNANGHLVAAYDFEQKYWKCVSPTASGTPQAILGQVYDYRFEGSIYYGIPTKNPSSCPDRM